MAIVKTCTGSHPPLPIITKQPEDINFGGSTPPPAGGGLLGKDDLIYRGTFSIEASGSNHFEDCTWCGAALAVTADGTELYTTGRGIWSDEGNRWEPDTCVGRVLIPEIGGTATWTTSGHIPPDHGKNRLLYTIAAGLEWNGRFIQTNSYYYDGADTVDEVSHIACDTDFTNYSSWFTTNAQAQGYNQTQVSCHMCVIPPEWRERMGGPCLTGASVRSRIEICTNGHSFFVFDPDDITGTGGNFNSVCVGAHDLEGPIVDYDTPIEICVGGDPWNGPAPDAMWKTTDGCSGFCWPEGTNTILVFGMHGQGPEKYKCYDPCIGDASYGNHANPYVAKVWAYDANDLLAVKDGDLATRAIRPYDSWEVTDYGNSCSKPKYGGLAYDPIKNRVYLTLDFEGNPTVHVIDIAEQT